MADPYGTAIFTGVKFRQNGNISEVTTLYSGECPKGTKGKFLHPDGTIEEKPITTPDLTVADTNNDGEPDLVFSPCGEPPHPLQSGDAARLAIWTDAKAVVERVKATLLDKSGMRECRKIEPSVLRCQSDLAPVFFASADSTLPEKAVSRGSSLIIAMDIDGDGAPDRVDAALQGGTTSLVALLQMPFAMTPKQVPSPAPDTSPPPKPEK